MPFNFWFLHTPPGDHIDGISGDCDFKKNEQVKWFNVTSMVKVPHSPLGLGLPHEVILSDYR